MTDASGKFAESLPLELEREIDRLCDEFEQALKNGLEPQIEDYLIRVAESGRKALLRELTAIEREFRHDASTDDFTAGGDSHPMVSKEGKEDSPIPQRIGRYAVRSRLGRGAFGDVYLAHDSDLDRLVALKVPRKDRFSSSAAIDGFLAEARTAARLDHPGIVKVHDVSRESGTVVIVLEYVEGQTLADSINSEPSSPEQIAELISEIADAVNYANEAGLVHRDLKPANILIDTQGRPRVADFGLAIHEDVQRLRKGERAGSPAYMAPEQVRGETHRLDGRTDQWSLGVILYELLTRRRPFEGDTNSELFEEIDQRDPKPPRQIDPSLPPELERICLKCLSKRMSDRYPTLADLAADLRHWRETGADPTTAQAASLQPPAAEEIEQRPAVIPKGLRSFDEHDADFFLELLPGPRDREGLPESLRFWKTRIEERDSDQTFSVGLIYGPSGCGKTSLVRAGLLPRLADHVCPVYVEATPDDTEVRLLHGLRKHCPDLPQDRPLPDVFAALREGRWLAEGTKVLIVLDQFEQWLHARGGDPNSQLIDALRQCDGGRLQCIVMVRDDFWLAVSRFMRDLEIRLIEAQNSALVDLFDTAHATKVLATFGRAFNRLPENADDIAPNQTEFLKRSVTGLAEENKIICVRLALFAEMMKGKSWTPAALKEVGGTQGVGVTFLEETFSASTAPPEHRYHQKAARAVLKVLLPESGTDIKGQMKSRDELLEASGYANRPKDFDDLIRILDSEIRLITPTDPEGAEAEDGEPDASASGSLASHPSTLDTQPSTLRYYQLTHDFLVPSLRDWLTRKQKETRRGRAELRLEERSAAWNAKQENRYLPSWWEHVNIRLFTSGKRWTESQRRMMANVGRVHGIQSGLALVLAIALAFTGVGIRNSVVAEQERIRLQKQEEQNEAEAARLVDGLLRADTSQVATFIEDLKNYRTWADADLKVAYEKSADDTNAKLHAALALLSQDVSTLDYLRDGLLNVTPTQFQHVRDILQNHKQPLIDGYWKVVKDARQEAPRRFQAACALATFDADNEHWQDEDFVRFVADHLVNVRPSELAPWRNALWPVQDGLIDSLQAIYRDSSQDQQVRSFATETLAEYLGENPDKLFGLLADAGEKQFPVLYEKVSKYRERAIELAEAEVTKAPAEDASEEAKDALAERQANAAVLLVKLDVPDAVWPLLRHSPDPRVRSFIIHRLSPLGGDPQTIIERYEQETDKTIQRALLLCLGEFDESQLPVDQRQTLIQKLLVLYRNDPDAGLHASAEWLLKKWGQVERLAAIDKELQQNEEQLRAIRDDERQWYVNTQGQTFVILNADEFLMGSPESEPNRLNAETLHRRRIGRRFAISAKEVTKAQYLQFRKGWSHNQFHRYPEPDCPIGGILWYEAASYCNWLSDQEGIPKDQWCYEPNEQRRYAAGMKAKENFLELSGYRLPTEAEWEFSCRAGTATSRSYGLTEKLLPKYAWYLVNSDELTWPVGSLKPNDFGLFDMYGNVREWCYDPYKSYSAASQEIVEDAPQAELVNDSVRRLLRGGSFNYHSSNVRSADRYFRRPADRDDGIGFRPSRTYNLSP